MITSNGAGNIQSSEINDLIKNGIEKYINLDKIFYQFFHSTSTKDMLHYKAEMNRLMLELIDIQTKIEYINRGWE